MIKNMAILTDVTKCIGCEQCVQACKTTYNLPPDKPWRWQRDVTDLSATRWTTIINRPEGAHVRKQCRHCKEPACVSVCPVGALQKTPEGPVIYDGDICMGCRYCMMACPFGIPRYTWAEPVPYVRKCIMCYHKIKSGELSQPACTGACPTGATIYGEREKLLEQAHMRIKRNPRKYIDKVWGEHEVGGTNVLYVSDIDLSFLGWSSNLGDEPLPQLTWPVMKMVPAVFVGVGLAMTAAYWVIDRRMKRAGQFDSPHWDKNTPEKVTEEQTKDEAGNNDEESKNS